MAYNKYAFRLYPIVLLLFFYFKPSTSKAQDLKLFEISISPISIPLTPSLSFNRKFNQSYSLHYNVNETFTLGFRYGRNRHKDIYTVQKASNFILTVNENNNLAIDEGAIVFTTAPEENIIYLVNTYSLIFRYNFERFRKIYPYTCLVVSYNQRRTEIEPFLNVSTFGGDAYLNSLRNAQYGYATTAPGITSSEIVEVPFKQHVDKVSLGLMGGIVWNINRKFAMYGSIFFSDIINRVSFPNTQEVTFFTKTGPDAQAFAERITLPNKEEETSFRDPNNENAIAYFNQGISEVNRVIIITIELGLTYKFLYKRE
ncbi:hypothetical protein V6R21_10395 [Limibacter armeniacum]|uniref:hypothetical protein n=1 Tax=Limibacter armeniacum TaxID=466084 RepID=UPI002FE60738